MLALVCLLAAVLAMAASAALFALHLWFLVPVLALLVWLVMHRSKVAPRVGSGDAAPEPARTSAHRPLTPS